MIATLKRYYDYPAVRFLAVGGMNFALVYVTYLVAIQFIGYRPAYWIAVGVGLVFMSVMNIRHTFTHNLSVLSVTIYGLYYYGYSLLHVTFITWLIEDFAVMQEIAPVITLIALTPPHYVVSKYLVKRIAQPRSKPLSQEAN